jgi:copper resistance protein D
MARILVVWLHIVAAAVWIGGLLYASHLVVPAIVRGERAYLTLLARSRPIAWSAIALLVLTGLENLRVFGIAGSPWLMAKLLLVVVLLSGAAHRDFALVPRATREIERGVAPGLALAGIRWLDRALLVLAFVVVLLAAGLARGR